MHALFNLLLKGCTVSRVCIRPPFPLPGGSYQCTIKKIKRFRTAEQERCLYQPSNAHSTAEMTPASYGCRVHGIPFRMRRWSFQKLSAWWLHIFVGPAPTHTAVSPFSEPTCSCGCKIDHRAPPIWEPTSKTPSTMSILDSSPPVWVGLVSTVDDYIHAIKDGKIALRGSSRGDLLSNSCGESPTTFSRNKKCKPMKWLYS